MELIETSELVLTKVSFSGCRAVMNCDLFTVTVKSKKKITTSLH